MSKRLLTLAIALFLITFSFTDLHAQSFGVELHNALMPASGGMAGASIARPQDPVSAINGNPATLTQMRGTQFSFGGAWAEPTYNVVQSAALPPVVGVTPYAAKSNAQGTALGNIGVTQDLSVLNLPVTFGMGFVGNAGAGVDFRRVPESNGTSASYVALDIVNAVGIGLTDALSVGASMAIGTSFLDGPFVGNGAMVADYALRGKVGVNYRLAPCTDIGAYWETKKSFNFDDAIQFAGGPFLDIDLQHPENVGIGIANRRLMDGRLLIAVDVLLKQYSDTEFLGDIYDDIWAFQVGAQYEHSRHVALRAGYAYNENPMRDIPSSDVGGVIPPGALAAIQYVQGQFAAIPQHRITGGVSIRDVLGGLDMDIFAGGMFKETQSFGDTTAALEGYWVGAGLTWRFGNGCRR